MNSYEEEGHFFDEDDPDAVQYGWTVKRSRIGIGWIVRVGIWHDRRIIDTYPGEHRGQQPHIALQMVSFRVRNRNLAGNLGQAMAYGLYTDGGANENKCTHPITTTNGKLKRCEACKKIWPVRYCTKCGAPGEDKGRCPVEGVYTGDLHQFTEVGE